MTEPLGSASDDEDPPLESDSADWQEQQQDVPGDLDEADGVPRLIGRAANRLSCRDARPPPETGQKDGIDRHGNEAEPDPAEIAGRFRDIRTQRVALGQKLGRECYGRRAREDIAPGAARQAEDARENHGRERQKDDAGQGPTRDRRAAWKDSVRQSLAGS